MLVIVALASAAVRGLWSNGLFSSVVPGFAGSCKIAGHVPGVQDAEIANGMVFLSVASARGPGRADGIYALPLSGGGLRKLSGAPADFHPRGIGLYRTPDGKGLFLMAVNRRSGASAKAGATDKGASAKAGATDKNVRFSIDSFEVTNPATDPALVAEGTIEGGLLINPQDVAMSGPGSFYVANGTAGKNPLMHIPQTYGLLPGGNVLYFNGMVFTQVADGLYGTRSLLLTQGGSHLVVGGLLSRSLTTFSRDFFNGALTEAGTLVPKNSASTPRANCGWRAMPSCWTGAPSIRTPPNAPPHRYSASAFPAGCRRPPHKSMAMPVRKSPAPALASRWASGC